MFTSRLDSIVAFVDALDNQSDKLLASVSDSEYLINNITHINNSITTIDTSIDEVADLMAQNRSHLVEFASLYEKAFYLESNLLVNDNITNHTSFETLTNEYRLLVKKFETNDHFQEHSSRKTSFADTTLHTIHESDIIHEPGTDFHTTTNNKISEHIINPFATNLQEKHNQLNKLPTNGSENTAVDSEYSDYRTPTKLKPQISISNLKLKPIRCNSTRINKKRSRYRLSSIYNLNPIAYEDAFGSTAEDDLSSVSHTPRIPRIIPSASSRTSCSMENGDHIDSSNVDIDTSVAEIDDIHDDGYEAHDDEEVCTENTSPLLTGIGNRMRSNSLPDIHSLFSDKKGKKDNFHLNSDFDEDPEQLRISRLKHFISFGNIYDKEDFAELDNVFHSSPCPLETAEVNIDSPLDLDNVSICSDLSYFDKEIDENDPNNEIEFNNFENYLRKSRIDLQEAFPHLLRKSNSFDSLFNATSIFSEEVIPDPEEDKPTLGYKFHNPIESIKLSTSSQSAAATIEPIYFRDNFTKKKRALFAPEPEDPKRILSEVMSRNEHSSSTRDFSAFSSPGSVSANISSLFSFPAVANSPGRRDSIDSISKSLTDSFLNLVNTPTTKQKNKKTITPQKIRDLKRQSKEKKPIIVQSDSQTKRMPIRIPRNDGQSTSLKIGPNKTKIVSYGESSIFRKPLVSRVSHSALRDALSQSLL
ncbi:hypothetical protein G9P44_000342 [Scheffersomyces stipitis]|nr:hypothetical protein G9P44_000342 [Scheffersomyces stipitis]